MQQETMVQFLLANEQNLLAAICEGSIVGEAAASMSGEVLALLRAHGVTTTEDFVRRLARKKILKFCAYKYFLWLALGRIVIIT
jgi:hypothetical protein